LSAYTDVVHRSIFRVSPGVNVHDGRRTRVARIPFGPVMQAAFDDVDALEQGTVGGGPARLALIDAAHDVFVERGYHATRVDDIAEAAGVSHGALYRYFRNKDEVVHLLAARALRTISATFVEIPGVDGDGSSAATLRRWLRAYNRAQLDEAAILRVWVDAAVQDERWAIESAGVRDWGRRRMMHFLEPRGFGNPDIDGVVLVAFLDAFGAKERSAHEVDAASRVLLRGFLGKG
jgi:AcrR family transcriptional regulator